MMMLAQKFSPVFLSVLLAAFVVASAGLLPAAAQDQNPAPPSAPFTERVEVNVVNVEVFVTDKKGRPVTGLSRDDFELTVDGDPRPISNFYAEEGGQAVAGPEGTVETLPEASGEPAPLAEMSAEPVLRLVVFVDRTALKPTNAKRTFKELTRFLEESLGPRDEVAVVSLSPGLELHTDFTGDRKLIEETLEEIQEQPFLSLGTGADRRYIVKELADPRSQLSPGEALSLVQTSAATENQVRLAGVRALSALIGTLSGVPGRKALLHVSDGIPSRPGEDLYILWRNRYGSLNDTYEIKVGLFDLLRDFREVARQANAGGVTFYALDAALQTYAEGGSAEYQGDTMESPVFTTEVTNTAEENKRATAELAAQETGGRRITASGHLRKQLGLIGDDFDNFYSLGFEAPAAESDGLHEVRVRIPGRKDLTVRHRSEYAEAAPDQAAADRTLAALLYGVVDDPLGVRAVPQEPQPRDDGKVVLPVALELPFDRLALVPDGDGRTASLSVFVTVQQASGATQPIQRVAVELRLPEENVEAAQGQSARYEVPVILAPGDVRVALGVRDDVAGIVSTLRLDVAESSPPPKGSQS